MSFFASQIAGAQPKSTESRRWFEQGDYPIVQIDELKIINSQKPTEQGVSWFIIVADVLESRVSALPAGTRGISQRLKSTWPGSKGEVQAFVRTLFPGTPEHVWQNPATFDPSSPQSIVNPAVNVAHGLLLSLNVWNKQNQVTGKTFGVHQWSVIPAEVWDARPELQNKAAALRTHLGMPPM